MVRSGYQCFLEDQRRKFFLVCKREFGRKKKVGKKSAYPMIKLVSQSIPNYIMSCYKLSSGCCDNMDLGARWVIGNGH